ncbi:MAG: GH3 auxin-responsive promoter, partial [Bacteroidetes bacterium]
MPDSVTPGILKRGAKLVKTLDRGHFSALSLQKRTLRQLLRQAGNTAFGEFYDFPGINGSGNPIDNFRKTVPIHDYDKIFNEWWHRSLKGEKNIAWRGTVKYFGLSSGTTGAASKYIPITTDMTRAMRQTAFRMFASLPKYGLPASFYLKNWFMIGGSASLRPEGNCFVGDLSGINAKQPPIWVRPYFKPGVQIAHYKDWDERIHAIAENAPKWDIGVVTGIPSWVQLAFEYIIDFHKLDTIHDIWPTLSVFVTGGTAFPPYQKSFEKLLAKPLIYQDSYLASEGFVAYQARPGT